jgi:hypothetical protein
MIPDLRRRETLIVPPVELVWGCAIMVHYEPNPLGRWLMALLQGEDEPEFRVRVAANDGSAWIQRFSNRRDADDYVASLRARIAP